MAQIFDAEGRVHPVTVIHIPRNLVTQVKTVEKDGYSAIQLGVGERKEKNVAKPQRTKGAFKAFREFRDAPGEAGALIEAGVFAEGDTVTVSALSKAKGFQGVVKRHGFGGGRRTHGQKHSEREPGSIGGGPGRAGGRVVKGMRMAGRMGGNRVTVKNLSIVKVDAARGELFIRGAVPGRKGTLVEVVAA